MCVFQLSFFLYFAMNIFCSLKLDFCTRCRMLARVFLVDPRTLQRIANCKLDFPSLLVFQTTKKTSTTLFAIAIKACWRRQAEERWMEREKKAEIFPSSWIKRARRRCRRHWLVFLIIRLSLTSSAFFLLQLEQTTRDESLHFQFLSKLSCLIPRHQKSFLSLACSNCRALQLDKSFSSPARVKWREKTAGCSTTKDINVALNGLLVETFLHLSCLNYAAGPGAKT